MVARFGAVRLSAETRSGGAGVGRVFIITDPVPSDALPFPAAWNSYVLREIPLMGVKWSQRILFSEHRTVQIRV